MTTYHVLSEAVEVRESSPTATAAAIYMENIIPQDKRWETTPVFTLKAQHGKIRWYQFDAQIRYRFIENDDGSYNLEAEALRCPASHTEFNVTHIIVTVSFNGKSYPKKEPVPMTQCMEPVILAKNIPCADVLDATAMFEIRSDNYR